MSNTIKTKGAKRLQKDAANQWQKHLSGHGPAKTKVGALGKIR